jgi:hypothetical protein
MDSGTPRVSVVQEGVASFSLRFRRWDSECDGRQSGRQSRRGHGFGALTSSDDWSLSHTPCPSVATAMISRSPNRGLDRVGGHTPRFRRSLVHRIPTPPHPTFPSFRHETVPTDRDFRNHRQHMRCITIQHPLDPPDRHSPTRRGRLPETERRKLGGWYIYTSYSRN